MKVSGTRQPGKFIPFASLPFLLLLLIPAPSSFAQIETSSIGGFVMEMPLSNSERLDAIRYLQSRIIQPWSNGRYFVRAARVLLPTGSNTGIFTYLVTFQTSVLSNRAYEIDNFYDVGGYYIVIISRDGDEFTLIDEIPLTPPELIDRLGYTNIPPPPELTSDPDEFDFTDAVFDASDPALARWRDHLSEMTSPRWEWIDVTGDGWLDCIMEIEGFEYMPTSYYTILIAAADGFIEGFRTWGYNTDFSEFMDAGVFTIRSDQYLESESGGFVPCWRNYYTWNGSRFTAVNSDFADSYSDLVQSLEFLIDESISAETDTNSRWSGLTRFAINVTRFSENLAIPTECYLLLARIAELQGNPDEAELRWRDLGDYVNGDYDSEEITDIDSLDSTVRESMLKYIEWRNEFFNAAEIALTGE